MYEYIVNAVGTYLCWYNSGGIWFNMHQFRDYLNARAEVWALTK